MESDRAKYILDEVLQGAPPAEADRILMECLSELRRRRYENRRCDYKQEWKPVLREGYQQYLVSNWGFVILGKKIGQRPLKPDLRHEYARVGLSCPDRNGAFQHMIHQLVIECFELLQPFPKRFWQTKKRGDPIINHIDGDKWNPSLRNLEITEQGANLLHAYKLNLRKPRC